MHHDSEAQRSLGRTLWASLMIAGHVLAPWRRASRVRWGARPNEPDPSLPGEDLIAKPSWDFTHAVSIAVPAEQVWPWLVQIGQGRGGFYSFERLENIVGCRISNADAILPEHQTLAVGDEIRLHPEAPLQVTVVEPGRTLVLRGTPSGERSPTNDTVWAFHLTDDGPGRCRLVERGKSIHGTTLADRLSFSPLLVEPIGFVMSREMLLGIKARAEAACVDCRTSVPRRSS